MGQTDKQRLRRQLLDRRAGLSPQVVAEGSERVLERVRALPEWANACETLVYWPIRGEIDVRPLVAELWQRGCRVLMPRCRPDATGELEIACAACENDLTDGPFTTMEPDAATCPPVDHCRPELALIPGVGFDRNGARLGFGGGYYDRLLASGVMDEALTVGLAYDFQVVEVLPTEDWDKPVDLVCAESELWRP